MVCVGHVSGQVGGEGGAAAPTSDSRDRSSASSWAQRLRSSFSLLCMAASWSTSSRFSAASCASRAVAARACA